jgi:hypothetical protein
MGSMGSLFEPLGGNSIFRIGQQVGAPGSTNQQPQTLPATPSTGMPANANNMASIFQALMNGRGQTTQKQQPQNLGQSALQALQIGGQMNAGQTAVQPQYGTNNRGMINAAAKLGNVGRFGQPANTLPQQQIPRTPPAVPQQILPPTATPKVAPTPAKAPVKSPVISTTTTSPGRSPYAMTTSVNASSVGKPNNSVSYDTNPARQQQQISSGLAGGAQQAYKTATQNGQPAGSTATTMLMNSMTPQQRQQFLSTGKLPQASSNPYARQSLIR